MTSPRTRSGLARAYQVAQIPPPEAPTSVTESSSSASRTSSTKLDRVVTEAAGREAGGIAEAAAGPIHQVGPCRAHAFGEHQVRQRRGVRPVQVQDGLAAAGLDHVDPLAGGPQNETAPHAGRTQHPGVDVLDLGGMGREPRGARVDAHDASSVPAVPGSTMRPPGTPPTSSTFELAGSPRRGDTWVVGSSELAGYCSFTKAIEQLGDRWILLIVRELGRLRPARVQRVGRWAARPHLQIGARRATASAGSPGPGVARERPGGARAVPPDRGRPRPDAHDPVVARLGGHLAAR